MKTAEDAEGAEEIFQEIKNQKIANHKSQITNLKFIHFLLIWTKNSP